MQFCCDGGLGSSSEGRTNAGSTGEDTTIADQGTLSMLTEEMFSHIIQIRKSQILQ